MPSLQDMRERAKEAGLMKLDKLIASRQRIPDCTFPIPVKELCERYERLYDLGKTFGVTVTQENVSRCTGGNLDFLVKMKKS